MTQYNASSPPRLTKTYYASVRMTGRRGTALVSAFGNIDRQGDRIVHGAFAKCIADWRRKMARGERPPYVWSHAWGNPDAYLGPILDLRETSRGLEVDFEITADTPFAKQVNWLLQQGLVSQQSFAYDVLEERPGRDGANELVSLDLIEAGPTLRGANPQTGLIDLKSLLAGRATRDTTTETERLEARLAAIGVGEKAREQSPRVDEFVAAYRAEKAERERLRQLGEQLAEGARLRAVSGITEADVDRRESERAEREQTAWREREAEREREAAEREADDLARRAAMAEAIASGEVGHPR